MKTLDIVILVLVPTVLAFFFWRRMVRLEREHAAELERLSQRHAADFLEAEEEHQEDLKRLEVEAKETFERGVAHLTEQMGAMQLELERARELAQDALARKERYFTKITDFEKIAHDWQKSYYEQSIGHGNAQQIMMDCIETLARQLQGAGIAPKIPSVIHAVRSEFMEQHQVPSVAGLAELQAAQAKAAAAAAAGTSPQ